jgi:hypothetical protein
VFTLPPGKGILFPVYTELATQADLPTGKSSQELFRISQSKTAQVSHIRVSVNEKSFLQFMFNHSYSASQ